MSTNASWVRREPNDETAACTSAVTLKHAFAPSVFGTLPDVTSGPKSPPGVVQGELFAAISHVASPGTKDVVTGKIPMSRVAPAPPACTVSVSVADSIVAPAGTGVSLSKSGCA